MSAIQLNSYLCYKCDEARLELAISNDQELSKKKVCDVNKPALQQSATAIYCRRTRATHLQKKRSEAVHILEQQTSPMSMAIRASEWLVCPCWATSDSNEAWVMEGQRWFVQCSAVQTTCSDHLPAGEEETHRFNNTTTFPVQNIQYKVLFYFGFLLVVSFPLLCCPLCSRNETAVLSIYTLLAFLKSYIPAEQLRRVALMFPCSQLCFQLPLPLLSPPLT